MGSGQRQDFNGPYLMYVCALFVTKRTVPPPLTTGVSVSLKSFFLHTFDVCMCGQIGCERGVQKRSEGRVTEFHMRQDGLGGSRGVHSLIHALTTAIITATVEFRHIQCHHGRSLLCIESKHTVVHLHIPAMFCFRGAATRLRVTQYCYRHHDAIVLPFGFVRRRIH